jgi:membrane dipeptidase
MNSRALELHEQAVVVVGHDHTMIGVAARRERGENHAFSKRYAPSIRKGGVDVITLVVGGDRPRPAKGGGHPWWDSLALIDELWDEANESQDALMVCLNCGDIDQAVAEGKVAVLMAMEGGRPVTEGPGARSLVNLRLLHRLGIRVLQLVGSGWNPLVDAAEDAEVSEGLSEFGRDVIREMNRLGMVIDAAHLTEADPLFSDIVETSEAPIIASHHGARGANDIPSALGDEGIKAIAEKDGVIGIHFASEWVNAGVGQATVGDLIRHIDHIVELVGVEHVGLGPDFGELEWLGMKSSEYYIAGIDSLAQVFRVTEALVESGYSDQEVKKILGENFFRVYRQVIG